MGLLGCKKNGSLSSTWIRLATFTLIISAALQAVSCESEPTESQCRPYIERALKQQHGDAEERTDDDSLITNEQEENVPTDELTETIEDSVHELLEDLGSIESEKAEEHDDGSETNEDETEENGLEDDTGREDDNDKQEEEEQIDQTDQDAEGEGESMEGEEKKEEAEEPEEGKEVEEEQESDQEGKEVEEEQESDQEGKEVEEEQESDQEGKEVEEEQESDQEGKEVEEEQESDQEGKEVEEEQESDQEGKEVEEEQESDQEGKEVEEEQESDQEGKEVEEEQEIDQEGKEEEKETEMESDQEGKEIDEKEDEQDEKATEAEEDATEEKEKEGVDEEDTSLKAENDGGDEEQEGDEPDVEAPVTAESEEKENEEAGSDVSQSAETQAEGQYSVEGGIEKETQEGLESQVETPGAGEEEHEEAEKSLEGDETPESEDAVHEGKEEESSSAAEEDANEAEGEEPDLTPEEDLTKEVIIPENLRPRDHITKILRLDEDSIETESALQKTIDSTLKSLKGLYDAAIKPLEMLYKYRDLSNRHFGDPEIFSKPLILFMGPWSGGKSSTINYLLDNEFTEMSLRTGAEPSPAYFNILMYGAEEEVLDGTQLAADWTFSGLQKFGQSLLDRLKGYKLPNRLLEKVNIVEIPGILEIRKQVQRLFPFNDACQWFIDRADIIFLVYDPSKLDVGPETEAILDQLKGREYQTRIILNKADQVKPEEIMRVQGTLIWNISPLMSSSEPPVMYTTSLWSMPYETGAPTRLLLAQERAFLRDMREAIDKRVENKIASARRFAVRVRNHAKMVDCYLTTYYNHKTFFGNRKKISDDIIENPQKYHIYEGLSTLTNISRYDLPDPDVYRDFFKLNPLYDFTKLSDTCTYFRGCPINTLDVAIAYDLPELVGKYKKLVEASKAQSSQKTNS